MYVFQEHLLILYLVLLKRESCQTIKMVLHGMQKTKYLEIGHVLNIDCTGSLKTAFRPVSHLVKTTCSLLIIKHKNSCLPILAAAHIFFNHLRSYQHGNIAAGGLSIKLGTCCSVAMVGIGPVVQTIAFCYLALVARIALKK